MQRALSLLAAAALGILGIHSAHAQGPDPWVIHFGASLVEPKPHNGTLAGMRTTIDSDTRPSASIEYFFTANWSIEALAAVPFKHDVKLDGSQAARTKYLPPVVGVNYHFLPQHEVSPFLGVGINYTHFFDTNGRGVLEGANVRIRNTWNPAAHAGLDFHLPSHWLLTADVRWLRLEPTVRVNGAIVGKARTDPLIYAISAGYRF